MSNKIETPIYLVTADVYLRFPEIMEEEYEDLLEYLDAEHILYERCTGDVNELKQLETNITEAIRYIKSNPNVFYDEYLIDVETLLENECTDEIAGEIRFISTLLSILERGKEND